MDANIDVEPDELAVPGIDERELQEALKRSLHITNLEESQLSEAVAASIRSHDEEVALAIYREDCAKIVQDHTSSPKINSALNYSETFPHSTSSSSLSADFGFGISSLNSVASQVSENDKQYEWSFVRNSKNKSRGCSTAEHSAATVYGPPNNGNDNKSLLKGRTTLNLSTGRIRNRDSAPLELGVENAKHTTELNGKNCSHGESQTAEEGKVLFDSMLIKCPKGKIEIVIDGQNVACTYGNSTGRQGLNSNDCFSSRGLELAVRHFCDRGIRPIAFLPRRKVSRKNRADGSGPSALADEPAILERLAGSGLIAFTPSNTHDDYFIINYAVKHDLDLVSNDRFRKEVEQQESWEQKTGLEYFLQRHLIPFTFVGDDFVPNPNPSRLVSQDYHGRELS